MNAQERKMMNVIKDNSPALADIVEAKGKYSRYDCHGDNAFVELKYRKGKQWEDTMIEWGKYQALTELPKTAVYAVQSEGKIYVFNLSRLTKEGYDFRWEDRYCNKTSEFHNQSMNRIKVSKRVGYIDWDKADRVIQVH